MRVRRTVSFSVFSGEPGEVSTALSAFLSERKKFVLSSSFNSSLPSADLSWTRVGPPSGSEKSSRNLLILILLGGLPLSSRSEESLFCKPPLIKYLPSPSEASLSVSGPIMLPNPIDSLAFLRIVAALSLVKRALFGIDDREVVCLLSSLFGVVMGRDCGSASMPKAELCGTPSSMVGSACASLLGFSRHADGCGAFRCVACDFFGVSTSGDVSFTRFAAVAAES